MSAPVALANHNPDNWYPGRWKREHHTGLVITWRFNSGFPNDLKRDRMKTAFSAWNSLNQDMRFEQLADSSEDYTLDCTDNNGEQPYNGIFWGSIPDQNGANVLARAKFCAHADSPKNTGHHFSIKFNSSVNWHGGADPGASTEHDFGGVATHEVGHATGGWTEQVGHWPAYQGVCDGTLPFHSMCSKKDGEKAPFAWRSLEEHDKSVFVELYPP